MQSLAEIPSSCRWLTWTQDGWKESSHTSPVGGTQHNKNPCLYISSFVVHDGNWCELFVGFFGCGVCQLYSVVLFGGWFHKISESSEGLIDMQLGADWLCTMPFKVRVSCSDCNNGTNFCYTTSRSVLGSMSFVMFTADGKDPATPAMQKTL